MKRRLSLIGAIGLLFVYLTGCGGGRTLTKEERAQGSLVFGQIDMDEAPSNFQWLSTRVIPTPKELPYWNFGVHKNRIFLFDGLPKGSYQMDSFGGHSSFLWIFNNQDYSYNFPGQGNGFRIQDQGVYFMGAFKYKAIKGKGFFTADKWDLERVKSPTEKELLIEVIGLLKKMDSPLVPLAEKHLRSLQ